MKSLNFVTNSSRVVTSSTISVTNDPMIAGMNRMLRKRRTILGPSERISATSRIIAVPSRNVGHSSATSSPAVTSPLESSTLPSVRNAIATPKFTVKEAYSAMPSSCDQVKPQLAVKPSVGWTTRPRNTYSPPERGIAADR